MNSENGSQWVEKNVTTKISIAQCHIKRIGYWRTTIGGMSMYLGIPLFLAFDLLGIVMLYNLILTPVLKLKRTPWKDYIILDRHKIKQLPLIDRLDCVYCGLANGTAVFLSDKIDELGRLNSERFNAFQTAVLSTIVPFSLPVFILFEQFGCNIVYGLLVAPFIGLKRIGYFEARRMVREEDFGKDMSGFFQVIFRMQKAFSIRLSNLTSSIEVGFCPIKHLDKRAEVRYPDHHERFFEADQLDEMKKVLETVGSV